MNVSRPGTGALAAVGLTRCHPPRSGRSVTPAVDRVDLTVAAGERVAVVGRSGSGKSTLLRLLLAMDPADRGRVTFDGVDVRPTTPGRLRWFRRRVQYVPQDPALSLDPRRRVRHAVRQPLRHLQIGGDHEARVREVLDAVGLDPSIADRRPDDLSGGQRQRVALARALAPGTEMLLADEPVSGLDLPLRAQTLDLLARVSVDLGVGLLVVTHDLAGAARLCERSVVMHAGRLVEDRPTTDLLTTPTHPAARELVATLPRLLLR